MRIPCMSPEGVLSLCLLIPFLYAGVHMLTDPSNSIRVLNRILADTHRIETSVLLVEWFAEPRPIANSRIARVSCRCAGLIAVAAGLFRLYSL